jgi:putative endonuclease
MQSQGGKEIDRNFRGALESVTRDWNRPQAFLESAGLHRMGETIYAHAIELVSTSISLISCDKRRTRRKATIVRWPSFNPQKLKALLSRLAERDATITAREETPRELAPHLLLGQRGERLAAEHLEQLGYVLIASNFTLPVGRNLRGALVQAEIDLIAYEGATLCFIEVKTRASDWFAAPEANVDLRKQRQISRAARVYRRMFDLTGASYRYDVVSVILPPAGEQGKAQLRPRLEVLRNFWTDEKFRRALRANEPDDY